MTKPEGRIKRDLDADALRAARAYVNGGRTKRQAARDFHIGLDRLERAIDKLRAERAAGGWQ